MSEPTQRPVLRVIAGSPTPDEVGVVVAVLSAVSAAGATVPRPLGLGSWSNRARRLGRRPAPGPTTWRDSGLPM